MPYLPLVQVPFEGTGADDQPDGSPASYLVADGGRHPGDDVIVADWDRRCQAALADALAMLTPRERAVLDARMLSASGKDIKLKDLARRLGVSIPRVSQIERQALEKVKRHVLGSCPPDSLAGCVAGT